jgi:hypothetical protein
MHLQVKVEGHPNLRYVDVMVPAGPGPSKPRAVLVGPDNVEVPLEDGGAEILGNPVPGAPEVRLTRTEEEDAVFVCAEIGPDRKALVVKAWPHGPFRRGLLDPEERGEGSYLPLLWADRSWLARKDSTVEIHGKPYRIPARIDTPFFTGLHAIFTQDLTVGLIRTGVLRVIPRGAPEGLRAGQAWTFDLDGAGEERLEITAWDGESLRVRRGATRARLVIRDSHLSIEKLDLRSRGGSLFWLSFDPPLPEVLLLPRGAERRGEFKMGLDEESAGVSGTYRVTAGPGEREILLAPESPRWAQTRQVRVRIARTGDAIDLRTGVGRRKD